MYDSFILYYAEKPDQIDCRLPESKDLSFSLKPQMTRYFEFPYNANAYYKCG